MHNGATRRSNSQVELRLHGEIISKDAAIRALSLTARLAVGLHCFSRYCDKCELVHPAIAALLNDLWEFPVVDELRWDEWEDNHPDLIGVALGDDWPPSFESFLADRSVDPLRFRELLENLVEIVFGSFYAAAEDEASFQHLGKVMEIVGASGIPAPPFVYFAESRFTDRGGWGKQMTTVERDAWRNLNQ